MRTRRRRLAEVCSIERATVAVGLAALISAVVLTFQFVAQGVEAVRRRLRAGRHDGTS
jgi:hypothetical protein